VSDFKAWSGSPIYSDPFYEKKVTPLKAFAGIPFLLPFFPLNSVPVRAQNAEKNLLCIHNELFRTIVSMFCSAVQIE
jgi:hypothetical protein